MRSIAGLGLFVLMMGGATPLLAAPATGGCVPGTSGVSADRATTFLENPVALLSQYKEGQGSLASEIRDMLTMRPETVEGMVSLAKASSADQSRAIGAGMGTAASVCVLTQPAIAQQIQEVVLKTENPDLIQAFASITGDIPTEAITGADPTGNTTSGGGRGSDAPGSSSAATTIIAGYTFSAASITPSTTTPTTVTAAAGTPVLTPVSPTN
jgi:hypothetical protein